MFIKKIKTLNLKNKNYVWKKNDFLNFLDDFIVYNNISYSKNSKKLMFNYLWDKSQNTFLYNIDLKPIYKTYRIYCKNK